MTTTGGEGQPDLGRRILAELGGHSQDELFGWVAEVVRATSEENKRLIAFGKGRPWGELEAEVLKRIQSWNYDQIHGLHDYLYGLGNVDNVNQTLFQVINARAKDPKLEAYSIYRYFGGKPRLRIGVFSKI